MSTAVKRSARAQYDQIYCPQITGKFKNSFKKSEDKAVTGKRSFKRWVSVESSYLFNSDLIALHFVLPQCISSTCKCFEMRQIFKTLAPGCDVGFCVWPLITACWSDVFRWGTMQCGLLRSVCLLGLSNNINLTFFIFLYTTINTINYRIQFINSAFGLCRRECQRSNNKE